MLLFSTYVYTFAKTHSDWKERIQEQLANPAQAALPCMRTLGQALSFESCVVHVSGPALIAPARSENAGRLLRSEADVWLTVDDDIYADASVLSRMVRAARATRGVVSAPHLQRRDAILNIRMHEEPRLSEGDGYLLASISMTGFGLVALHRDAIDTMARAHPELEVEDKVTHEVSPALFLEEVHSREWVGEDFAFCRRARAAGIGLYALCNATVVHDGRRCEFEAHGGEVFFRVYDDAAHVP